MKHVNECPSAEDILAVIERPGMGCTDANAVFEHLLHCRKCRSALAFTCEAVTVEQERKRQQTLWRLFHAKVSSRLSPGYASSEECIDAIAAEAPATLIIQSMISDSDPHFWRATMTFPDVDQSDSSLEICIYDSKRNPLQNGTFRIFGLGIPIVNGVGYLTRDQLAKCHHKGGASFTWQDGASVPGAPVLNV